MALLLGCVLLSHPAAEVGINDEWSYVRTVKLMAETGHFHYVGWASAMLGWIVPLGAIPVRLFGFSFTAVRSMMVLIGLLTAFLLQRIMVRAGLREGLATFGTLTIVLCPLFFPLTTTYMSDLPGVFVMLLCTYGCLSALAATTERAILGWLVAALVLDAVGGTARQTAWFGLLVMVPCAVLLLRRRLSVSSFAVSAATWLLSVAFLYGSMKWFSLQPYSLGEALEPAPVTTNVLSTLVSHATRATLDVCLYILPTLAIFWRYIPWKRRGIIAVCAFFGLVIAASTFLLARHHVGEHLAPWTGNVVSIYGLEDVPALGDRAMMLGYKIRLVISAATLFSILAALAVFLSRWSSRESSAAEGKAFNTAGSVVDPRSLQILLLPMTAAYLALVAHRGAYSIIFDRYLLWPMIVAVLFLLRFFQNRVATRLSWLPVAVLVVYALFGTAANHDLFAMERARVEAANELIRAGVPRTRFYAGWEYDGWTEVNQVGYVNSGAMRLADGSFTGPPPVPLPHVFGPCDNIMASYFPTIRPAYGVAYSANACDGPSSLPAVPYHSWLPPYGSRIYIQKIDPTPWPHVTGKEKPAPR